MLVFGDRGTGKSTAVRALAALLPPMRGGRRAAAISCDPGANGAALRRLPGSAAGSGPLPSKLVPVPVVDLPLGATEDRVVGALDLERALARGEKAFEPGLLARAHRGFLYIDEVNLLEDHLVDLLLDVAASGENVVEREGLSVRHPARFVLVGSGNPEEGELRPQLLDRFGLSVEVSTPTDLPTAGRGRAPARRLRARPGSVRRQVAAGRGGAARGGSSAARAALASIEVPDAALERAAQLCIGLGTDGLRGELTLMRAARALAALEGERQVGDVASARVAPLGAAPSPAAQSARRGRLDARASSARAELLGA